MIGIQFSRKNSLDDKKKKGELLGKNCYGFIYRLVIRESEDNVHRLLADITVVYLGLQSIP